MSQNDISVCLTPNADDLQFYAAGQLRDYLQQLFAVNAKIQSSKADSAGYRFVLGRTDQAAMETRELPKLSDQGFLLRRVSPKSMLLIGGSSAAVAWAVYELLERYGVRFLLHGDVLPERAGEFHLPELDTVFEPVQKIRSWRQFCELPTGPGLWSLDQQISFISQLFKLKFNGVYFSLWPQHPFIDYQVKGISRNSACMLFGQKIPVDADTIGREHLPMNMRWLNNPCFLGAQNFEEQLAAGQTLLNGMIDHAKSLGMHTAIAFEPMEFPLEFRKLLQNPTEETIQLGGVTCAERGDLTNPAHQELIEAKFRAYLEQYGQVDEFFMELPEHPQADANFQQSWDELAARFKLEPEFSVTDLLTLARGNHLIASGDVKRAEREFKSTVAMLNVFSNLFSNNSLLQEAAEQNVRVGVDVGTGAVEAFPLLNRVLWEGASLRPTLAYTASRAVRNLECLEYVDAERLSPALVITLQDDNIGSLPQVATENIHILLQATHRLGWRGFFTRHWPIGDLDPTVAYLARASWDASVTPRSAYVDHFSKVYGETSVEPFCQVMRILEDATVILDLNFLGILFPVLEVMSNRVKSDAPMPEGLFHIRAMYEQCHRILLRLKGEPGASVRASNLAYWIGRLEFAIEVLREYELLCRGGVESHAGRSADEFYRQGIAAGQKAIEAIAANVRDDSDRATLAAYYHFLVREVKQNCQDVPGTKLAEND